MRCTETEPCETNHTETKSQWIAQVNPAAVAEISSTLWALKATLVDSRLILVHWMGT